MCVWFFIVDIMTLAVAHTSIHPSTQMLQPMQGLGRLKKSPPTISAHGLDPPISDSQPLCTPCHSIHPSEVWSSHSPRLLPSGLSKVIFLCGGLSYIRTICPARLSLVILIDVTKSVSFSLIIQMIQFFIISRSPYCPFTDRSIDSS